MQTTTVSILCKCGELTTQYTSCPPKSSTPTGFRLWRPSRLWHFADARVTRGDQVTCMQGRLLEVRRIGGEHLPSRDFLPEHFDRSHVRKFAAQRFVVFLCGGEPHSVIGIR